ncbi:MAG: glycyl-radical enzyme activating protein, partial [Victivallales bacterium]|nr:glycyl-radical enzyme activating protein [Victivallales bacterium]
MNITATIADLRRLTIHDGPGTRDTVFVKGCPLRCLWCHNPESISAKPQILFRKNLCTGCGECAAVCPSSAQTLQNGTHVYDRARCITCGKCAEACLNGALTLCGGKPCSPEEVFRSLIKDREFFLLSNGGVTISGGEPLLYPEFTLSLFKLLHGANIHTALDTCGAVTFSAFETVLPETDMIL